MAARRPLARTKQTGRAAILGQRPQNKGEAPAAAVGTTPGAAVALPDLVNSLADHPRIAEVLSGLQPRTTSTAVAPAGLRPGLVAAIGARLGEHAADSTSNREGPRDARVILAVTATTRESEDLAAAVSAMLGGDRVALFPVGRRFRTSGCLPAATWSAVVLRFCDD